MKTFVRCIVAAFLLVGMANHAAAQSSTSEKDPKVKVLTQEQINSLSDEQMQYLKVNGIQVVMQDATTDVTTKEGVKPLSMSEVEQMRQPTNSGSSSTDQFSDANLSEEDVYEFKSTGSEAGDIAKKEAMLERMQTAQDAGVNGEIDPEDQEAMQHADKIVITRARFESMSPDEKVSYNENPDNYVIKDSNK